MGPAMTTSKEKNNRSTNNIQADNKEENLHPEDHSLLGLIVARFKRGDKIPLTPLMEEIKCFI